MVRSTSVNLAKTQNEVNEKIEQLKRETELVRQTVEQEFRGLQASGLRVDLTQLPFFLKRYWRVTPTRNPNEWEVAIPVIFDFNVGLFDRVDGGYNVFLINQYTRWFGEEIPHFISSEINLPQPENIVVDGLTLNFPEDKREKIEQKFGKHLSIVEKDHASIKQGNEFDLLSEIIASGSLPFKPKPVAAEDLMESDFTQIYNELEDKYEPLDIFKGKYSYEGDAWNTFAKYSRVGVYWSPSFGKTVIGTYCLSRIRGKKALVVPTLTLKEQWLEFFKRNCPRLLSEVEICTYQGMSRQTWQELTKKQFNLIVFDEVHVLAADSFSRLATLQAKYVVGMSATVYREDHRENFVLALCGYPIGLDWRVIMKVLGKEYHTVNVHVVKDLEAKYVLTKQLYNPERRTLIFVNLLDIGEHLASMLNLPFIQGETKNRLEIIKESKSFVASRVLELGVSIKDLEHVIEVDFLRGSRREELQRSGRLLHSTVEGKIHDIIMTKEEIESYGKRLFSLYEKGFHPRLIPHLSGVNTQFEPKTNGVNHNHEKAADQKNWTKTVADLSQEGFFLTPRSNSDVASELKRRGITINKNITCHMSNILTNLVRQKTLFKTPTTEGIKYASRNAK